MTDNMIVKDAAGVNQTLATDFVDSKHHQIVKQAYGANDSVTQVSSSNPLPVNPAAPSTVYNGATSVTTAGTAVSLAASQTLRTGVYITANSANTGNIYVGGSGVDATNGTPLAAEEKIFIAISNLSSISIDADTNANGVRYLGF